MQKLPPGVLVGLLFFFAFSAGFQFNMMLIDSNWGWLGLMVSNIFLSLVIIRALRHHFVR